MDALSSRHVLELRKVVKHFDGVAALRGASLAVARGTVHGLIGQNGAGKSTLIKILAGIHRPDSGIVAIDGRPAPEIERGEFASRIGFIHQERLLPATFTVAEALALGREPVRGPRAAGPMRLLDRRGMRRHALETLRQHFDVALPPNRLIGELSVAEQQIVQITRALQADPRILVFDEPTASLVSREVDRLLQTIDRLRARGLTILYVSHYLNEIAAVCDRVTVLRDGADVAHVDARTTPVDSLVAAMIGAPHCVPAPTDGTTARPAAPARRVGPVALRACGLSAPGRFEDVSLTLRRGEIVGITGLLGSGGKPLLRSLFGLEPDVRGALEIDGRGGVPASPRDAARRGMAYVPDDRRAHGIAPALSVRENMTLASLARVSRLGLLSPRRERRAVGRFIQALAIRSPGADAPLRHLSGGNQQKVVLAKWLHRASTVYLLDEPTVGVDIGAKAEIYRLLDRLAAQSAGIILFSSDLTELLAITDRVLVMARGRIVHELTSRDASREALLAWITGARHAACTGNDEIHTA